MNIRTKQPLDNVDERLYLVIECNTEIMNWQEINGEYKRFYNYHEHG